MESYFPGQRWMSEGEPELGVGIVIETSKGRVQMHFPISDETRLYATAHAPLRRVVFKVGDSVVDAGNRPMLIERIEQDGELVIYCDKDRSLSEVDLGDVSAKFGIEDRLSMGEVDSPNVFALRRRTLEYDHRRRVSAINGFVGGRIDLIPHQLYIAHEVSERYAPRVLLSDQVGLGKTIEACLILHRLLLSGRISRVMILVPDSLVHQWFVEVLRRFNLWFHIFDEERCVAIEESAPDGNPFLDDQLIICSTDFLANSEIRTRQALSASWDMLVVDEAHHLEWSVDKVSPEYSVVELLSQVAKGLLLLTATPEQLGVESHFARLRLMDPIRYADYDVFKNESLDSKNIANIVQDLSADKSLKTKDISVLKSIFGDERMKVLAEGGDVARNNIIEDLLDQHGPGRVIFRNTRSAMSGFPKRKPHLVPIEAKEKHDVWVNRMSDEFKVDLDALSDAATEQKFWFSKDPRVDWLIKTMDKLQPEKILLICRTKEKVLALEQALAKRINFKVSVFHEDLTIVQRDRNAAWFSEPEGARLLLCSEIGSEGRNFQFAHHLVLFDLPFHPELLEQRIGRLDRIGQTENIHIHVPYIKGSSQEVLARWYHEGLNTFAENLEGGSQVRKLFGGRLLKLALTVSSPDMSKQLDALIADTVEFKKELKKTLAKGRDRLLEMNSYRPQVAAKLVEQIQAEDKDLSLENYMTEVFEHFNVEMEDLAARTYLLHPSHTDTEAFPSIPDAGISITFDRKRALSREDVSFITWDHPMTTGALDMVLGTGAGAASFGVLRGSGSPAILLELLFVLETAGEQSLSVDRFLPNSLIRVVVDHAGRDVAEKYSVDLLEEYLVPGQIDELLDNDTLMGTILPTMITAATSIAEIEASSEISVGLEKMRQTMEYEIDRLKLLKKKNTNIRAEEIHAAADEQVRLASLIGDARIRLDAIQLIRKDG